MIKIIKLHLKNLHNKLDLLDHDSSKNALLFPTLGLGTLVHENESFMPNFIKIAPLNEGSIVNK